jgi:Ca2+-binding EF-hand superfamily protein
MTRCLVTLGLCTVLAAPAAAQSPGDEGVGPGRTTQRQQPREDTEEQPADEPADEDRGPRRERGERGQDEDRGGRGGFGGFRRPNPLFEAIDANGDGSINNAELRKAIAAIKKLDADGDGNITLAEASPQGGPGGRGGFGGGPFGGGGDPAQMVDGMIQNLDRNRDGQIGLDEVDERSLAMLSRFRDVNGDGALNRQELIAGMEQMRQQFGGGGGGGFGRGGGGGGFDPQQMTERMLANDKNGDGKLQADEVPEQFRGMLRGADENEDGAIDARELAESTRRMGERFRGGFGRGGRGGEEEGDDGERRGRRRPEAEE